MLKHCRWLGASLMALLVVGYISFTQIPVELMPAGFSPPFLGVYTPYPNSNPQEVEHCPT